MKALYEGARGKLVLLEGADGVGKSTLAGELAETHLWGNVHGLWGVRNSWWRDNSLRTPRHILHLVESLLKELSGEALNKALLDIRLDLATDVLPQLWVHMQKHVVVDRWYPSAYAYQGSPYRDSLEFDATYLLVPTGKECKITDRYREFFAKEENKKQYNYKGEIDLVEKKIPYAVSRIFKDLGLNDDGVAISATEQPPTGMVVDAPDCEGCG